MSVCAVHTHIYNMVLDAYFYDCFSSIPKIPIIMGIIYVFTQHHHHPIPHFSYLSFQMRSFYIYLNSPFISEIYYRLFRLNLPLENISFLESIPSALPPIFSPCAPVNNDFLRYNCYKKQLGLRIHLGFVSEEKEKTTNILLMAVSTP